MGYAFQTYSSGEVLRARKLQQVEYSARDHVHGSASVTNWAVNPQQTTLSSPDDYFIIPFEPEVEPVPAHAQIALLPNPSNSGDSTFRLSVGLGWTDPLKVRKFATQPLIATDIQSGVYLAACLDGSYWQLLSSPLAAQPRPSLQTMVTSDSTADQFIILSAHAFFPMFASTFGVVTLATWPATTGFPDADRPCVGTSGDRANFTISYRRLFT